MEKMKKNMKTNDGAKSKLKKSDVKKLFKKFEDKFTKILLNSDDAAGSLSKKRSARSLFIDSTEKLVKRIPKNQRKKRKLKSCQTFLNHVESGTSDDEVATGLDPDGQLAALIKFNLAQRFFTPHVQDISHQRLMKKSKRIKQNKERRDIRKAVSSESEFDADEKLSKILEEKIFKLGKSVHPESSLEFDSEEKNYTENDQNMETGIHETCVENSGPGRFVRLNPETQPVEQSGSNVVSKYFSLELGSSEDQSSDSKCSEDKVIEHESKPLIDGEKLPSMDTVFNIAHTNTLENISNTQEQQSLLNDETNIYDTLENYEPTGEIVEEALYDSVFEINPDNNLNDYTNLQNITSEPLDQVSKVNGVANDISSSVAIEQNALENGTNEDIVEILSSDDEGEKSIEKEQIPTNDRVCEEISDDVFNDVQFYTAGQQVVVVLKHPTRLYFWGKLVATALFGNVCVQGCNLQPSIPYTLYSPRGLGKLYFETLPNEEDFNPLLLFPKLSKTGLSVFDTEQIVTSITDSDVVLYLQNNTTVSINYINLLVPNPKIFPSARRSSIHCNDDYKTTLQTFFYKQEECNNGLKIGENWHSISNYVFTKVFNAKVLVCGGKGVGKSTFNRFLLNSCVNNTPVIYIDLDVGQPEFAIPGTISATKVYGPIFGPSYTHIRTNFLKMRFIREIDVMENIDLYLNGVQMMMNELWEDYSDLPWIINTMGFVKTFGESINIVIIRLVKPSFVVQIHDKDQKNNYLSYMKSDIVHNYNHGLNIELPPEPLHYEHMLIMTETDSKKVSLESKMIRELNVIAYFSNMLDEDNLYLTEIVPQMAPIKMLKIWTFDVVTPNLIRTSLNGCLIALCKLESDIETTEYEGIHVLPYMIKNPFICLGFGIVRGVDDDNIYVLTPLSSTILQSVNCIASCSQTLPSAIFTKISPNIRGQVPFVSLKRDRPITANIPKRNYSLQHNRAARNSQRISM